MTDRHSYENLCGSCSHKPCCTECISPLVFAKDISNLEKIKHDCSKYLETINIQGINTHTIRKKRGTSECVFWDSKNTKCSIYENRPFDCKMFPFDIIYKDGKFFWIVFECNPNSNWDWTEPHLERLESDPAFDDFLQNIYLYATLQISDFDSKKTNYTVIRQVRIQKQIIQSKSVSKLAKRSPI